MDKLSLTNRGFHTGGQAASYKHDYRATRWDTNPLQIPVTTVSSLISFPSPISVRLTDVEMIIRVGESFLGIFHVIATLNIVGRV